MTKPGTPHPSGINQAIVDKVVARRGRLHAFERFDPAKTALVVVDLDLGTGRDNQQQIKTMSTHVNNLATALRKNNGTVAFITTPIKNATNNFKLVFGEELTKKYEADGKSGKASTLWPELKIHPTDIITTKHGHSTFFPGKCDLHKQLQQRHIASLLIAGAVTNVCCEASARDAAELGYQVTMVSDALIGHAHGLHEASLATFFRCYGDVRPTNNVLELI